MGNARDVRRKQAAGKVWATTTAARALGLAAAGLAMLMGLVASAGHDRPAPGERWSAPAAASNVQSQRYPRQGWNHRSARSFRRIATFPVFLNQCADLDGDAFRTCVDEQSDETVAEIVAASNHGATLIYTDSASEAVGFIDLRAPSDPRPLGVLDVGGEPTSVAVATRCSASPASPMR